MNNIDSNNFICPLKLPDHQWIHHIKLDPSVLIFLHARYTWDNNNNMPMRWDSCYFTIYYNTPMPVLQFILNQIYDIHVTTVMYDNNIIHELAIDFKNVRCAEKINAVLHVLKQLIPRVENIRYISGPTLASF